MGMSSSQARLLTLTARMHSIEYKAARLEAQKLQMANESRRVYEEYLNALEATKIQGIKLGSNGQQEAYTLNLNLIESNRLAGLSGAYKLVDPESGKTYVTQALADKYNLDPSGEIISKAAFLERAGFETIVTEFDPVTNPAPVTRYTSVANQVQNAEDKVVPAVPNGCGFKDSTFGSVAAAGTAVSDVATFNAGQTYTINNKEDLKKLATLTNSGVSTAGVNFVLTSDIDMTGETWTGIGNTSAHAFKGIFDGNFHKITNLTGSQGLFCYVTGKQETIDDTTQFTQGIVRNLKLENVNINGGSGCAGLIGKGNTCYVENVYVSGELRSSSWAGGVIGENTKGTIVQTTSTVNVTAGGNCIGGFTGHDTSGVMVDCLAKGNVTGTGSAYYVGGFIGHETNGGTGVITGCAATGTVSATDSKKGSFIGFIDSNCNATINDSQYQQSTGVNAVGAGSGPYSAQGTSSSLTEGGTQTIHTQKVILPSKQSIKSNIEMAISKAGATTPANLDNWLNKIYQIDATLGSAADPILIEDALKLASINNHICNFLSNGENSNVVTALIQDINNNTLTMNSATRNYQDYYKVVNYEYTPYASADNTARAVHYEDVTTGSVTNIANNLYTAFRKLGHTDVNNYKNFQDAFAALYPANTDARKLELAELNNYVTRWLAGENIPNSDIEAMYTSIVTNNTKYTLPNDKKAYTNGAATYTVNMVNDENQEVQAKIKFMEYDMADPEVIAALAVYDSFVPNGYIIVSDELSQSPEWLSNMVNLGAAMFHQLDSKTNSYFETSVSTNTGLQEVTDETKLKKAEAKYEADMKRIDLKDRKYDTDLAALEAERNAIKQEMETLKTVAKENVERTFKLFS